MTKIDTYIIRYLDGTASSSEKEQLLAWLKESEDNRKTYLELRKLWITTRVSSSDFDKYKAYEKFVSTSGQQLRKRRVNLYKWASVAACLIGILATSVYHVAFRKMPLEIVSFASHNEIEVMHGGQVKLILSNDKEIIIEEKSPSIAYGQDEIIIEEQSVVTKSAVGDYDQLVVPFGKLSSITFEDGTKVWVNAGTRLVYPKKFGDVREIFVEGEIYLDVAQDENRPFIVRTNAIDIKVLGTCFNVNSNKTDNITEVVLVSGSVGVSSKEKKVKSQELVPGDKYTLSGSVSSIEQVNIDRYTLWINGYYLLERDRIGEIMERLSRYYGVPISVDPAVAQMTCSGKLDLKETLPAVLKVLAHTAPIEFSGNEDGYRINLK